MLFNFLSCSYIQTYILSVNKQTNVLNLWLLTLLRNLSMNTSNTTVSKLNDSLEQAKELVKKLQAEKHSRNDILVQLNKLVYDTSLFSQKQRAIVIREINKEFDLKVTMSEVKRAVKTVNVKKEPAVPVDGLTGTATLDLEPVAATAPEETTAASISSTTQESDTMKPITEVFAAVSGKLSNVDAETHAAKVEALKATLAKTGANTEEERIQKIEAFFNAHPSLATHWAFIQGYPQGDHGITSGLVAFLEINPAAYVPFTNFLGFLGTAEVAPATVAPTAASEEGPFVAPVGDVNASAPAAGAAAGQPEISVAAAVTVASGYKDRIMTTLRGKRETGFSSGVVAAAAAVVGGGLEMAFKGNAGIGSSVGTALGATGAYFLGNATDEVMGTETGRYLLAGAIGVAAGGIGSRVGRAVEGEFKNPSPEVLSVLESIPGVSVSAPATEPALVGNSEALFAKFGL